MKSTIVIFTLAAGLVLLSAGMSLSATDMDNRIVSSLAHRSTSAVGTSVTTDQDMVTLYGKAENKAEFDLATQLARDIKGVKAVNNRMVIE